MFAKLAVMAIMTIVGFILTIKGSPSYWQIIGLLLVLLALGGAAFEQLRSNGSADNTKA